MCRFHPGFHMLGYAHVVDLPWTTCIRGRIHLARLQSALDSNFAYCGLNKAKVYYGTQRSAPPAESRDQFVNNSTS